MLKRKMKLIWGSEQTVNSVYQERLKFNLNSVTAELLFVYGLHNLNPDRKKYAVVIQSPLH